MTVEPDGKTRDNVPPVYAGLPTPDSVMIAAAFKSAGFEPHGRAAIAPHHMERIFPRLDGRLLPRFPVWTTPPPREKLPRIRP